MLADGTWGDHVILHGAAYCFQTCIHVISSLPHRHDVMICPEFDVTGSNRLVLGHVHELHYVSLIPQIGGKDVWLYCDSGVANSRYQIEDTWVEQLAEPLFWQLIRKDAKQRNKDAKQRNKMSIIHMYSFIIRQCYYNGTNSHINRLSIHNKTFSVSKN